MKNKSSINRRNFLKRGAALAGAAAGAHLLGVPAVLGAGSPNDKLGIAVIGCGGQGSGNPGIGAQNRLVALVDVDENKIAEALKKLPASAPLPKIYYDYRKMYDECHKELDAVMIATPDHNHAPAAIRAIQLGKHVFCEKPLTWCLYEARKLTDAARRHHVATQMGNQGHSGEGYRVLCEYIWSGAIGNVTETHSMMSRNFGGSGGRPESKPQPSDLHWDEWLGPAEWRDYHEELHTFNWRNWCEFGTGTLGDMGCHVLDGVFWALKLGEAKTFTIECVKQHNGSIEKFPQDNHLRWEFPARGGMPAVKLNSYDHEWPEVVKELEAKYGEKFGGGTVYIGDKGAIYTGTYGENPHILDKEKHKDIGKPKQLIARSKHGSKGDFIAACKGEGAASSSFDYSGPFTEFVLTGVLASRAGMGRKIEWDVEKLRVVNIPELNWWVKRQYRKGWAV